MEETLKNKVPNGASSAIEKTYICFTCLVCWHHGVAAVSVHDSNACLMKIQYVAGYGKRVNLGDKEFGRYPENLLNSRVRYSRAFKVCLFFSMSTPCRSTLCRI